MIYKASDRVCVFGLGSHRRFLLLCGALKDSLGNLWGGLPGFRKIPTQQKLETIPNYSSVCFCQYFGGNNLTVVCVSDLPSIPAICGHFMLHLATNFDCQKHFRCFITDDLMTCPVNVSDLSRIQQTEVNLVKYY